MVGGSGNAAHPLDEVEGGAFGAQDGSGRAVNGGDILSGIQGGAVIQQELYVQLWVDAVEDGCRDLTAGQHSDGLGAEDATTDYVAGNEGLGGWIVERLVFSKCRIDEVQNLGGKLLGHVVLVVADRMRWLAMMHEFATSGRQWQRLRMRRTLEVGTPLSRRERGGPSTGSGLTGAVGSG